MRHVTEIHHTVSNKEGRLGIGSGIAIGKTWQNNFWDLSTNFGQCAAIADIQYSFLAGVISL
jgi:hypothetical protein